MPDLFYFLKLTTELLLIKKQKQKPTKQTTAITKTLSVLKGHRYLTSKGGKKMEVGNFLLGPYK